MKVRVINGFYDADLLRIVEKDEIKDFDEAKAKKLNALKLVVEEKKKAEAETEKATARKKK